MSVKVRQYCIKRKLLNFSLVTEGGVEGCTLEDVCVFFSGASSVPPGGWPKKPKIEFIPDALLPTSSTCSLILRLPTVHKNYEQFKNVLILALRSNDGFGGP